LIVVFIGGAVGGLYGLILAIPVACLKIFVVKIPLSRLAQ
jgi:predicted PurR-regulated permease PerM